MNNPTKFLTFINEFMAIDATEEDWDTPLTNLKDWDSVNAVRLMSRLESTLVVRIPVNEYLQVTTLHQLYDLLAGIRS